MARGILNSLYNLSLEQMRELMMELGQPSFRADQIWRWLYLRLASSYDEMSDVPRLLRDRLSARYVVTPISVVAEQRSSDGWTRKWLLRLSDGMEIETVLMEYADERHTVCVSTQVGCGMGCSFCATGQMGFARNLSAGEIIAQVIHVARVLRAEGETLTNVVFMGMGEPFANYHNVVRAIRQLNTPVAEGGFGMGMRRFTVSTAGLVSGILHFSEERWQVNLAVSLHAATDELRNRLVPLNRRHPLQELVRATRRYIQRTNRRVSYEWVLIEGVNDTAEQAEALVKVVEATNPHPHARLVHVNLIPLNQTAGFVGQAPSEERQRAFCAVLDQAGVPHTLRVRRGIDIAAGCGQLRTREALRRSAALKSEEQVAHPPAP